MTLIVELTLFDDLLLFRETFTHAPDAECVFEDTHYLTDDSGNTHYVFFWWMTGTKPQKFDDALEGDQTVSEFERITELQDRTLYRIDTAAYSEEQPLVFPSLREHNVTIIESKRNADGLHLRARFPSRESLRKFRQSGMEIANKVQVNRLYCEESARDEAQSLTHKQRKALALAYERGYFETPSEATLQELSAETDVTPQTLSRHVRVGVKRLVEAVIDGNADDQLP